MDSGIFPDMSRQKGGAKGSAAILKESTQLGCVSQDSYPRKPILRETGMYGAKHAVTFSKGTWHQIKISGKKWSISKSVRLMNAIFARPNSRTDHMRRL